MNRTLLIAFLWGVLAWNVVGLVTFAMHLEAGVAGLVAGVVVATGIIAARATGFRFRAVVRSSSSRGRVEA